MSILCLPLSPYLEQNHVYLRSLSLFTWCKIMSILCLSLSPYSEQNHVYFMSLSLLTWSKIMSTLCLSPSLLGAKSCLLYVSLPPYLEQNHVYFMSLSLLTWSKIIYMSLSFYRIHTSPHPHPTTKKASQNSTRNDLFLHTNLTLSGEAITLTLLQQ